MRPQASPPPLRRRPAPQRAGRNAPERPHPRNPAGCRPQGCPLPPRLFLGGLWPGWQVAPFGLAAHPAAVPGAPLPSSPSADRAPCTGRTSQRGNIAASGRPGGVNPAPGPAAGALAAQPDAPPLGAVDTPALPANAAPAAIPSPSPARPSAWPWPCWPPCTTGRKGLSPPVRPPHKAIPPLSRPMCSGPPPAYWKSASTAA